MTENVRIRPLVIEDAKTSYKWRNDKDVFKYTGNKYDHVITYETELAWITDIIKRENEYRCAILVGDVYVGNIYLTDIEETKAEYSLFLGDKNYWGKGVAKEASKLIIQYAKEILNLEELYLEVKKVNEKAIGLYKSLGFQITGERGEWYCMLMNLKKVL